MSTKRKSKTFAGDRFLEGQLLLAMPTMTDKRFRRSVIYMCRHTEADGAMGIIVNQRAKNLSFPKLLRQLHLLNKAEMPAELVDKHVHVGGPVSAERGFVLHSADFRTEDATLSISDDICLTATIDILKAIAAGKGPAQCLLALGYAGWAPGQLESELLANGWLHCRADHDLVFGTDIELTYDRALSKLGIDPAFLVSEAGHA